MSLFSLLDSFANGTIVDDLIDGLEKGVEQLERFAGSAEEASQSVVAGVERATETITSSTDKVSQAIDVVNRRIQ